MKTIHVFLAILLVASVATNSAATSSLDCTANNYLLRLHVNSDDQIAGITFYISKSEIYRFTLYDCDHLELKWARSEPPYKDNQLILKTKASATSVPELRVDVAGERGILILRDQQYPLVCY